MNDSHRLSLTEASALMASGRLTAVQLAEACLARVARREGEVLAWAHLDPEAVLAQAHARDREPRRSPLHGIPVGLKDIIDTADMPTEYGSPIYEGHRPRSDAACVSALRQAGAVIMGKTVTVEFAVRHPNKTRNPRNSAHTPGGSSSGSAAAVADDMVPLALGTQTGGSVIRPAAFCGVVGMKPSFNIINRAGVKPNSESLDTVGLMARTVPDVALALSAMTGQAMAMFGHEALTAPRIAFWRTPNWPDADAATGRAFEDAVPRLARAGARIAEATLPAAFDRMGSAHGRINDYEMVRALDYERRNFPDGISATLMAKIVAADRCTFEDYIAARRHAAECRRLLDAAFDKWDVLLVPSAPGEAPAGLQSTGNSVFNRIWTALHVPAVTVPVFTGPGGLPMGAQLIGRFGEDQRTLQCAEWVARALR